MGKDLVDRFSILHFLTGVSVYYMDIMTESVFVGAHIAFELLENTEGGMRIIRQVPLWPGGKAHADSFVNMIGDTLVAWAGFRFAEWIDEKDG